MDSPTPILEQQPLDQPDETTNTAIEWLHRKVGAMSFMERALFYAQVIKQFRPEDADIIRPQLVDHFGSPRFDDKRRIQELASQVKVESDKRVSSTKAAKSTANLLLQAVKTDIPVFLMQHLVTIEQHERAFRTDFNLWCQRNGYGSYYRVAEEESPDDVNSELSQPTGESAESAASH